MNKVQTKAEGVATEETKHNLIILITFSFLIYKILIATFTRFRKILDLKLGFPYKFLNLKECKYDYLSKDIICKKDI